MSCLRLSLAGACVCLFLSCGGEKKELDRQTPKAEKQSLEGPVTVALGDCAGPSAVFESGPRPRKFDVDRVEDEMKLRMAARTAQEAKPTEEDEHTGTKMTLDEGKMGSKESTRATGHYAMKKPSEDTEEAKRRARENAGVMGVLKKQEGGAFASLTGTGDFSSGLDDSNVLGGLVGEGADGTVGTGRYGTIGHGSGTGTGYGTGSGKRGMRTGRKSPSARIGNASATGDLDKSIIRRYIRRQLRLITHCYEKRLLVEPNLEGTVVVSFTITPDGTVADVAALGMDKQVGQCIEGAIRRIRFPKPKGGGTVEVRYPFIFKSSAGDGAAKSTAEKRTEPLSRPEPHEAGVSSPLRPLSSELEGCFRDQGKRRYGAAVVAVELDGGTGTVDTAKASGWGDSTFDACLSDVAKKAKWPTARKSYRCPVSFGPMPLQEGPGIDISPKAMSIKLSAGGKSHPVADVADMYQLLLDHREARDRSFGDRWVSITGPMFLRVAPEAPMKAVYRALKIVRAQGHSPVLATRREKEWKVLPRRGVMKAMALPVAPVPVGTGQPWHGRNGSARRDNSADTPRASVLLTSEDVWVGTSNGERFQIKNGPSGRDWEAVLEVLNELRKGPLKNQPAIEIGSEYDVHFADIADTVDTSVHLGFDLWDLLDPSSLTVRFKE